MSTFVASSYISGPSLGTAVFVQLRDPSTGATLVSRTNGGIREDVSASGYYVWAGTVATALPAYESVWDTNGSAIAGEIIIPQAPASSSSSGTSTGLTITGDANGTLLGTAFLIKRGDTKPYLRRQLVDTNGNAVTLGTADVVKFTMRASTDVAMAGTAKVHASAVIIDAASGVVEYRWAAADTNTSTWAESNLLGQVVNTPYAGEFEVTSASDSTVETFPQNGYIAITIPPDLDPGVDP